MMASTSEIYGKNNSGPLNEQSDRILGSPAVARWAYSTSKAVDEILAYAYHRERDLPTIVVRLFNTVGPRQSPAYGMVIPRLMRQALAGEQLTVYGDGTQTRCFCHVADVVDALLRVLDEPVAIGDVFNIGSSREISIQELAELIISRTGSSSAIVQLPYDVAYEVGFEDMARRVPDVEKLRRLTGWQARRSLEQVLDDVAAEVRRGDDRGSVRQGSGSVGH
jgi:UDP-glucose 4-epimerase